MNGIVNMPIFKLTACGVCTIIAWLICATASANQEYQNGIADRGPTSVTATSTNHQVIDRSCCHKKTKKVIHNHHSETKCKQQRKSLNISDELLLDQNGKPLHFYTDLVKGRTVAISNFYTSCTTVCPTLTATMAGVQKMLLENGRNDILLISISVDPATDTPRRLKAWSQNFGAKPGWTFVTGKKPAINNVLKSLKSFTSTPEDHTPMILVGNEPTGIWKQVYGLASTADLYQAIIRAAGPRKETTTTE